MQWREVELELSVYSVQVNMEQFNSGNVMLYSQLVVSNYPWLTAGWMDGDGKLNIINNIWITLHTGRLR